VHTQCSQCDGVLIRQSVWTTTPDTLVMSVPRVAENGRKRLTSTPAPPLDVAGLLTAGPGNPSLRTPGNPHYAHLCLIIWHTWTLSLP
jgi:hypothetical protein